MKSILDKIGDSSTGNESGITINLSISGTTVNETNPPIPTGFYHVGSTTIADGYVISDVQGDDLANSQGGNQFVWVPVQKDQVISLSVTSGEEIESLVLYNPYGDKIIDLTNQGKSYSTTINTYGNMDCVNGKYTAIVVTANEEESKSLVVRSLYAVDTFYYEMSNDEIARMIGYENYEDLVDFNSSEEGVSDYFWDDIDTEEEAFEDLGNYVGQEITTREQFGQIFSQVLMEDWKDYLENQDQSWLKDYTDLTEANGARVLYSESVNNNGGFYIGRYEAGASTARTSGNINDTANTIIATNGTPVVKANQIVYLRITRAQAKDLAESIYNTESFICTLPTGAAWDRTVGFLTETGSNNKTLEEVSKNSRTWGNNYFSEFLITNTNAKYSTNYGNSYTTVSGSYSKPENSEVLLTTGATERNSSKNIYDLAGNIYEWSSENKDNKVVCRGGNYRYDPDRDQVSSHYELLADDTYIITGFRPALFITD